MSDSVKLLSLILLILGVNGAAGKCVHVENRNIVEYTCTEGHPSDLNGIPVEARRIRITDMPLRVITADTFSRFGANLWDLSCSNCQITSIEPRAFERLVNLQHLLLDSNQLTTVKGSWFRGLTAVTALDLNYNDIRSIDDDVYRNMPRLMDLRLSGNRLECLNLEAMASLQRLKRMYVSENEDFKCPNALSEFMESRGISFEKDPDWSRLPVDLIDAKQYSTPPEYDSGVWTTQSYEDGVHVSPPTPRMPAETTRPIPYLPRPPYSTDESVTTAPPMDPWTRPPLEYWTRAPMDPRTSPSDPRTTATDPRTPPPTDYPRTPPTNHYHTPPPSTYPTSPSFIYPTSPPFTYPTESPSSAYPVPPEIDIRFEPHGVDRTPPSIEYEATQPSDYRTRPPMETSPSSPEDPSTPFIPPTSAPRSRPTVTENDIDEYDDAQYSSHETDYRQQPHYPNEVTRPPPFLASSPVDQSRTPSFMESNLDRTTGRPRVHEIIDGVEYQTEINFVRGNEDAGNDSGQYGDYSGTRGQIHVVRPHVPGPNEMVPANSVNVRPLPPQEFDEWSSVGSSSMGTTTDKPLPECPNSSPSLRHNLESIVISMLVVIFSRAIVERF